MRKQLFLIPILAFMFCFSNSAEAQNYQTALGARLGVNGSAGMLEQKRAMKVRIMPLCQSGHCVDH